jgi:hypothetical protein
MNKSLVIATVLMAAALTGLSSTNPMAAYAGDHDEGKYSGTHIEQKIKQRNVRGDGSSQFNCGQNNIGEESALTEDIDLCGTAEVDIDEEDRTYTPISTLDLSK